jgi:nucleoside 2-deoxyribosyltransferase
MDRVLARIREARFVVADFSGNRGGVYYEAGFALGLGKTVIHSCREEQLDSPDREQRLHFDVAHLKMIPWKADQLDDYAEKLENHIVAVFGRGPVRAS